MKRRKKQKQKQWMEFRARWDAKRRFVEIVLRTPNGQESRCEGGIEMFREFVNSHFDVLCDACENMGLTPSGRDTHRKFLSDKLAQAEKEFAAELY